MSDEQRNLELVQRLVTLWNEGDVDAFLALHSDDVELITDPEWPDESVTGRAEVARFAEDFRSAWDAVMLKLDAIDAEGDEVRTRGHWESRGAASGLSGALPFGLDFTIRDGLVVRQCWSRSR
jgi:ketosteroid isomerase-like protein